MAQLRVSYLPTDETRLRVEGPFVGAVALTGLKQLSDRVEPVFVIRALQPGAVGMLNQCLEVARDTNYPQSFIKEIKALTDEMKNWQAKEGYIDPPMECSGEVSKASKVKVLLGLIEVVDGGPKRGKA